MLISGWGRCPVVSARADAFTLDRELAALLAEPGPCIPYAMGRSYGDSALAERVVLTRRFNCLLDFDESSGVVTCEAGVTLADLVDVFLPRGWFLAVTPGTRQVSVGGAIASDVHGKNHHLAGCFSSCLQSLDLMLPDGTVVTCGPDQDPDLFRATCGGMGLTGVILRARLRLKPVRSSVIDQTVFRARNLEEVFALFEEHRSASYSVAWIDCLSRGETLGRSLFMTGEHAEDGGFTPLAGPRLSVPIDLPASLLNRRTVSLFNALYYRRARQRAARSRVGIGPFFFPLDAIGTWNRIYGPAGFVQYQFVLPREASVDGMSRILGEIVASGRGSFLAVLKLLGPANDNLLSFPMAGYTLALDFRMDEGLAIFLERLDNMVLDFGGRLYLTKDCRMDRRMIEAGYPRLADFTSLRRERGLAGCFESLQSRRLGI